LDENESKKTRLGSIVTDNQGSFGLGYGDTIRDPKRRPNLILIISAPQGRGSQSQSTQVASAVRRSAALIESFVIEVDSEQFEAAGVRPPQEEPDVEEMISEQRRSAERRKQLHGESQRILLDALKSRRVSERKAEAKFEHFLSALSGVSAERRNATDRRSSTSASASPRSQHVAATRSCP
jgi:hypothetical protein